MMVRDGAEKDKQSSPLPSDHRGRKRGSLTHDVWICHFKHLIVRLARRSCSLLYQSLIVFNASFPTESRASPQDVIAFQSLLFKPVDN